MASQEIRGHERKFKEKGKGKLLFNLVSSGKQEEINWGKNRQNMKHHSRDN